MLNFFYTIIIYPITQIIEIIFVFSQKLFRNTGLSIVAISAGISILCLPLYLVAENMQEIERSIQKRLKPAVDKIKAVFKGDERHMILSVLYRQHHYHPAFALRSSFGLLIQIPFFIAAYSYLSHLGALDGASFLFIKNLGAPDALVSFSLFPGQNAFSVNALPILMTVINCIAGAIYTRKLLLKDKIQLYGMAFVFLILLYNSPAGLVLYWTLNNVFSLLKNCYYAIQFKSKKTALFAALSVFCALMIIYLIAIFKGSFQQRILFSIIIAFVGISPWFVGKIKLPVKNSFSAWRPGRLFFIFTLSLLAYVLLIGFTVPSLLIESSPQEFSYLDSYNNPLYFVFNTLLQCVGFFLFWPLCLYLLFSRKTKETLVIISLTLLPVALCNVFLFPGNYGTISISLDFAHHVGHTKNQLLLNSLVSLLLASALLFVTIKIHIRHYAFVLILCCVSLFGLSVVNVAAIQSSYAELSSYRPLPPQAQIKKAVEPIFHLSKNGKNIVVVMLDRAISAFLPYIFEESPELYEQYKGFVYFPNTVTFSGHTALGAPPIFGGYESSPARVNERKEITLKQKHNEALLMMPRILSDLGYSITITDAPYANYQYTPDMSIFEAVPNTNAYITDSVYTDAWIDENFYLPSAGDMLKRNIFYYGIFRAIPFVFREAVYMSGDWCSPIANQDLRLTINGYAVLSYLPQLTDFKTKTENTVMFFVNNATHESILLQAPDYVPSTDVNNYGTSPFNKSPDYHINAAAIKRMADWFSLLKENDAYDNTKIILVSDHGKEDLKITKINLPFVFDKFNPLFMVKDFNASFPMKTDSSFMTNADVPSLVLKDIVENPVNPFTGNAISMDDKTLPLYIAISGTSRLDPGESQQIKLDKSRDYYVRDNIFDAANWKKASD